MLKKLSIFQITLLASLCSGLVPLLIVGVQSATLVQLLMGLIALVLVALGVSTWLAQRLQTPVQQLTRTAEEITTSVDADAHEATLPSLHHIAQRDGVKEIGALTAAFEQMVLVLQQRLSELNSVYAMGQAITAQVDFEQTVQAVLAAVQQVVVFDAAEVSVLRGPKLVVEAWRGQEDFNNTTGREYRVGRGPTGNIAASKAAVLVSTISGDEEDLRRTLGWESVAGEFLAKTHKVVINSFLGIPLLIGDRLIGTLTLVHRDPGRFTESDKRQLNKLAARASVAIDNAIQVRQRENILKAQIRELRVEIDRSKLDEEVKQITTTDYFQHLRANAAAMRKRSYTRDQSRSASPDAPTDTTDTSDSGATE